MHGKPSFAEVHFYFNGEIGNELVTLALVTLYSLPDKQLFKDSHWTVASVTHMERDGLCVVKAESIVSVVAVIPHSHHVMEDHSDIRFFVWEKMGLDMALLQGLAEEIDSDFEDDED